MDCYANNDMNKKNESDVGDVVFAKSGFKFLCFILFLALSNPANSVTRCPIAMGFASK